jgi:hypothetical protein
VPPATWVSPVLDFFFTANCILAPADVPPNPSEPWWNEEQ